MGDWIRTQYVSRYRDEQPWNNDRALRFWPGLQCASDAGADGSQLLLLLTVRLEDVAKKGAGRSIIERDRLRRESLATQVSFSVNANRVLQDDVITVILHAHGNESLAWLFHETEAHAIYLCRPWLCSVSLAVVALIIAATRPERAEISVVTALVSNDVLHVFLQTWCRLSPGDARR